MSSSTCVELLFALSDSSTARMSFNVRGRTSGNSKLAYSEDGQYVAKIFYNKNNSQKREDRFHKEIQTLKRINDMGIGGVIRIFEVIDCCGSKLGDQPLQKECVYVMPKYGFTDRFCKGDEALSYRWRAEICQRLIKTLRLLHTKGFYHRDLKPENIAVRETRDGYECALIDFGLAYDVYNGSGIKTESQIGSNFYRPPEYCRRKTVNHDPLSLEKAEVFSLAKTLLTIMSLADKDKKTQEYYPIRFFETFNRCCDFHVIHPEKANLNFEPLYDLVRAATLNEPESRISMDQLEVLFSEFVAINLKENAKNKQYDKYRFKNYYYSYFDHFSEDTVFFGDDIGRFLSIFGSLIFLESGFHDNYGIESGTKLRLESLSNGWFALSAPSTSLLFGEGSPRFIGHIEYIRLLPNFEINIRFAENSSLPKTEKDSLYIKNALLSFRFDVNYCPRPHLATFSNNS